MNTRTLITLVIAFLSSITIRAADYFVAPNGKDTAPGTQAEPFATPSRAQQAVRAARASQPTEGATVTFAAGRYDLLEPLQFGPGDSGASPERPVRYQAAPGAEVVISGGRQIAGWQPDPVQPHVWRTRLAMPTNTADTSWRFEQLWVNGQRAIRARTPNSWEFNQLLGVAEERVEGQNPDHRHTFRVKPADLAPLRDARDDTLRDVQVLVLHKWDTTREWLRSVDLADGSFLGWGTKMKSWNPMSAGSLFFLENHMAFLDAPGEWFLARDGSLFYWPRAGENMASAEVVAPRLARFLTFAGTTDNRVHHVAIDGLKFRHAEFTIPAEGLSNAQAAMNVDQAAIRLDHAEHITLKNLTVEHVGTTGVWFHKDVRHCRLEHARLFDLGIGGVRIGETQLVPEALRTGHITVDNCIIQSGGRIMPHAVGVWIGHSADNTLTHCDVADFYYTAVSVGWRWGYAESGAKRNRIEFNHLHHIGYRILSDMGGVYTLGPSEGTSVSHNWIHDVFATTYGGWGLYPDEGSTGIVLEGNLVHDVKDGGFHQHYGRENLVRNNIFAFSQEGQIAVTRSEPHLSFTFERNIVYWDGGQLLGYAGWAAGAKVNLSSNLYWRAGGQPFDFAGKTWDQWREAGRDQGSIVADPLFVAPERRDFRLQPGSPADAIGFQPFDHTRAGVRDDGSWRQLAASVSFPKPYEPPRPEPLSLKDSFEPGSRTPLLTSSTVDEEGQAGLVAVASGGREGNALKLQDSAKLHAAYNPHFHWDPHHERGEATLAYDIRLEPGAQADCEWRSEGHPYRIGPSLHFTSNSLHTRGRKLMDLPESAWIRVEMRTRLGHGDAGTWTCVVRLQGGQETVFKDLLCDPGWKVARWVGFSSPGRADAAFYLDNLETDCR